MKTREKKPPKCRGRLVLVATIYTAGVIAFSFWSYFQQRTNLLSQVDQLLINGTHATEQILGDIFIACAVEIGTAEQLGYVENQKKLDRLAKDCQFNIIGAIGIKETRVWELIAGCGQNETLPRKRFCDQLQSQLFPLIKPLANSKTESISNRVMELGEYGEMRIAIRYHPISTNTGYAILVARDTQETQHLLHALAIRTGVIGIILYAMAFPLILLFNCTVARSAKETAELNGLLKQDFIELKDREAKLEDAIGDLERFNNVALGRETRILELKAEINTLLERMGQKNRYNIDQTE
ncbi:MAG: hypothetical protein ABFR47_03225 [Verrucomicrobiota bacterium]